jgi:dephospho-CoA kinase
LNKLKLNEEDIMQVMGVSGLPGSGKSFISDIAVERGAILVSMGDIIREEAKKRGETTKETATNLRKEFGNDIVSELTIKKIKKLEEDEKSKLVIIEGIRSLHEVDMFKENFDNFIIVSVFANADLRFKRLQIRNREDDHQDYEGFHKRDITELGFGIGSVISLSDRLIINESDLESYKEKIHEFFDEIDL